MPYFPQILPRWLFPVVGVGDGFDVAFGGKHNHSCDRRPPSTPLIHCCYCCCYYCFQSQLLLLLTYHYQTPPPAKISFLSSETTGPNDENRSAASFHNFRSFRSSYHSSSIMSTGSTRSSNSSSSCGSGRALSQANTQLWKLERKAAATHGSSRPAVPSEDEPGFLLWRRVRLSQYLPGVPPLLKGLLVRLNYAVVSRPSNETSLGLQGWRDGCIRRWDLLLPLLIVFDAPGQAAPGEGFDEWPLFDVFKIDLSDLPSWSDYLASLRRADRWNVKARTKLFQLYESEGKLTCHVVRMGPQAFVRQRHGERQGEQPPPQLQPATEQLQLGLASSAMFSEHKAPLAQQQVRPLKHGKKRANSAPGNEMPAPPKLMFVTPGSVSEAEALLAQMWDLYEQTGIRNGFVECYREQFERLVRDAPNIHAVVVREGGSGSGPLLAFGLLLPQRDSLQVLYTGMKYDSPLVRQSCCLFQVLSVGVQVALVHNDSVRQRNKVAAAAAAVVPVSAVAPPATDTAVSNGKPHGPAVGGAAAGGVISALADGTAAGAAAVGSSVSTPPSPPPPSAPPPPHPLLLGPRVGLIEWLDLGPGRRFVKEHLGAVGHPVSMYTRGIGPISRVLSQYLLNHYFRPKTLVNDP